MARASRLQDVLNLLIALGVHFLSWRLHCSLRLLNFVWGVILRRGGRARLPQVVQSFRALPKLVGTGVAIP